MDADDVHHRELLELLDESLLIAEEERRERRRQRKLDEEHRRARRRERRRNRRLGVVSPSGRRQPGGGADPANLPGAIPPPQPPSLTEGGHFGTSQLLTLLEHSAAETGTVSLQAWSPALLHLLQVQQFVRNPPPPPPPPQQQNQLDPRRLSSAPPNCGDRVDPHRGSADGFVSPGFLSKSPSPRPSVARRSFGSPTQGDPSPGTQDLECPLSPSFAAQRARPAKPATRSNKQFDSGDPFGDFGVAGGGEIDGYFGIKAKPRGRKKQPESVATDTASAGRGRVASPVETCDAPFKSVSTRRFDSDDEFDYS
ncbi:hypothetical protein DIPPA_12012 [Diplonema papillatum]|nr:hypothetical protein DIPPA_12012 [Diplonema papillatum]